MSITKPYTVNTTFPEKVNPLRKSWAAFLNSFDWEWFVTLTFRFPVTSRSADRKWYKWIRRLELELNDQIGYFRCSEVQKARNALHFHALALNITRLGRYEYSNYLRAEQYYKKKKMDPTEEQLRQLAIRFYWNDQWYEIAGIGRVLPYKAGACGYISKYVSKELKDLSDYKFGGLILKT